MTHMSYSNITAMTNKYLDNEDNWTRAEEEYRESDYYQDDLEESGMTEQEYDDSPGFDNAVESFMEDMMTPPSYDW